MAAAAPHLLCLGLGYTARSLAGRLTGGGWRITGSARQPAGVAAIEARGWRGVRLDGAGPADGQSSALATALAGVTHLLLSAPPGPDGDPILRSYAAVLAGAQSLSWIGYLSTVGVYGDHAGAWVDETTAPNPGSDRGRWRLAAEQAWLTFGGRCGVSTEIFRLPGIYGPGRSVLDKLRAGTARRIVKPGQVFNRIHVDDIATALIAAMRRAAPATAPSAGAIYNLVDDEPSPPEDVVVYAAGLLGLPVPPAVEFERAQLSPMARSFYGEAKRVSNARMKSGLGVGLAYPTYREGLAAIAAAQS